MLYLTHVHLGQLLITRNCTYGACTWVSWNRYCMYMYKTTVSILHLHPMPASLWIQVMSLYQIILHLREHVIHILVKRQAEREKDRGRERENMSFTYWESDRQREKRTEGERDREHVIHILGERQAEREKDRGRERWGENHYIHVWVRVATPGYYKENTWHTAAHDLHIQGTSVAWHVHLHGLLHTLHVRGTSESPNTSLGISMQCQVSHVTLGHFVTFFFR